MKTPLLALFVALSFVSAASAMVGCYDSNFCEFVTCTGDGASTSSTPPVEDECNPLLPEKYAPTSTCGVFVRAGASGTGTMEDPAGSLPDALRIQSTAYYVCAGDYAGSIVIPAGARLFGGLACDEGWKHVDGQRSHVAGGEDTPAASVLSGAETTVYDFEIVAPDRVAPATPGRDGANAIAVVAQMSSVIFVNCRIVAGNGGDGGDGTDYDPAMAPPRAAAGMTGEADCSPPPNGVDGGMGLCGNGGGRGGTGEDNDMGGNGAPGAPLDLGGDGGEGGVDADQCSPGLDGDPGSPGDAGVPVSLFGTADSLRYTPMSATDARPGMPGGGGGGGGGSQRCGALLQGGEAGPSGGGGGAGGCGGRPGGAGRAGGSSFAIVSLEATVVLQNSEIVTGKGGAGGRGGRGELGVLGGAGGSEILATGAYAKACRGGAGGDGGSGGPGAGGEGGNTVAAVFTGTPPTFDNTFPVIGDPGSGGDGGQNEVQNTIEAASGLTGLACRAVLLGGPHTCAQ